MTDFRTERDSMGEIQLPALAYYGSQTQRAVENFPISGRAIPADLIHAMGLVKWAAAKANADLGKLGGSGKNPLSPDQIDALLPQTQCGQCSYAGCRPYAEAIAGGEAEINRCPPGGEATMIALAELLGRDPVPLEDEEAAEKPKSVAYIVEDECIGCTLCIQACPVDAILGAAKQMHTVIESECTGCELCLPPCPVDCIRMEPLKTNISSWKPSTQKRKAAA